MWGHQGSGLPCGAPRCSQGALRGLKRWVGQVGKLRLPGAPRVSSQNARNQSAADVSWCRVT